MAKKKKTTYSVNVLPRSFRLPPELVDRLRRAAFVEHTSQTDIVVAALDKSLPAINPPIERPNAPIGSEPLRTIG